MRLLSLDSATDEVILTDHPSGDPPPYAILSHTWGEDEVVFEDIGSAQSKSKAGYEKLRFCGEVAKSDGLDYFWVDTCCINKSSSAELAESINSMFRWYKGSEKCYVYLSDVSWKEPTRKRDHAGDIKTWEAMFRKARWFTRGWTLQELLAPTSVDFFTRERRFIGNKESLAELICERTSIPVALLREPSRLRDFAVRERAQWAAGRATTRPEDKAYSLLGIFDVFLSPIYGEGRNAVVRLNEAISAKLKRENDIESSLLTPSSCTPATSDRPEAKPPTFESQLLKALEFDQMDSRLQTIGAAHATTCEWFLASEQYLTWLDPTQHQQHSGFLWIKGKPGAGKSTLIKFAYARAAASTSLGDDQILLHHFFNARGTVLEQSTVGLYRSLLFQLLQKANVLHIFAHVRSSNFQDTSFWTIELLRDHFARAITELEAHHRVTCYIDALDECDEEEVRDMITHLETLGDMTRGIFRVCFASRHYPTIVIRRGVQLIVDDESGHVQDLAQYVQDRLQVGDGKGVEHVKSQVQARAKANGIFLWVVLVTKILNEEFRRGWIFNIKNRLDEIPAALSDLFKNIILRDNSRMEAFQLCTQWILFAERALVLQEFYFAMIAGLTSQAASEQNDAQTSHDDMCRFVTDCSKGLAEVTRLGIVQFIHESVRDFLLRDGGLCTLWPHLESEQHSLSHWQLCKCCIHYLKADLEAYTVPSAMSRRSLHISCRRNPFLLYVAGYVFAHANEAARTENLDELLTRPCLQNWIALQKRNVRFVRLLRRSQDFSHLRNRPLLYLLNLALCHATISGYQNLVCLLLDNGADINFDDARCGPPLQAAAMFGRTNTVKLLIERGADVNASGGMFGNAVMAAEQGGYVEIVRLLRNQGALD